MQEHLEQAAHNQDFHNCIVENFNDRFYDWKITVLFYVAIHYLKALAFKRNIHIGDTHFEIASNINPDRGNANMKITKGAWKEYKCLFDYSQTARYNGITDFETFEQLKQIDHSFCLIHLDNFKKYINSQGITV